MMRRDWFSIGYSNQYPIVRTMTTQEKTPAMHWNHWTVGTRLYAAFLIPSGLAMAIAWLGSSRLGQLDAAGAGQHAQAGLQSWLWGLALLALVAGAVLAWGLRRSIVTPLGEATVIAETVAAGDLSQDFATERTGEFGRLLGALGTMEDTLTDLVGNIKQSTASIALASRDLAGGNNDLSQRTEGQAASLQQTAASVEQLTATVRQNAERAQSASAMAVGASEVAQQGGQVVEQVVATMEAISGSSRRIADIIGVIDGIAFQTNILALNAAVEAARAGEQGRGFAVVASEVRALAQRSASAAHEIKDLIGESVRQVESGAGLVGQAGRTMEQVVQSVRGVTAVLGEISSASAEQRAGVEQLHQAVVGMDSATQQNAALVQQAAQATAALAQQAHQLQQTVDAFKL